MSDRPLIPGNLVDRIDENGQEWTRTDRVRNAVTGLVRQRTIEEIMRLCEEISQLQEERDRYHDALISRHGGEPMALLKDLDVARGKLREARRIFSWLLGEDGDFVSREVGQGEFYWRGELRRRIAELGDGGTP